LKNIFPNFRISDQILDQINKTQIDNIEVSHDWTLVNSDDSIEEEEGHKLADWTKSTSFVDIIIDTDTAYIMQTHPDYYFPKDRNMSTLPPLQPLFDLQNISDDEWDIEDCVSATIDPGYDTEYSSESENKI